MSHTLDELKSFVVAYASAFDVRSLTPAQANDVVRVCARIEASVASMRMLAAARAAERSSWKTEGHRSAAEKLACDTGTTTAVAKRALETGRRMANQPTVTQAALAGELSPDQADAVTDGVTADPTTTDTLIAKAQHRSLAELNEEVTRIKAAAIDQEARRRAIHAKRSLRRWTDRDGAFHAHLYGQPGDGTRLWRMIDPVRRRLNLLHNTTNSAKREPLDALDYDALMTLADIATGRTTQLNITDLIDLGLFPQLTDITTGTTSTTQTTTPAYTTGTRAPSDTDTPTARPSAATQPVTAPTAPKFAAAAAGQAVGATLFGPTGDDATDGVNVSIENVSIEVEGPANTDIAEDDNTTGRETSAPFIRRTRRVKRLAGSPAQVMIRVDLDALLRGVPIKEELCEIAGYGPVPVSVVRELIANENPFIVGILTKSQQLVGVYHHGRRPSAHQRSALDFLYPTCAVAGCNARAGLQYDHREDWAKTKYTVYDLLDRLCAHHHGLKTRSNWGLVAGIGKRRFVPPDDPDHPGTTSRRSPEAAQPGQSP
jgi:hypothetical protein